MIHLNTSTRNWERREISRIVNLTMRWCKQNLGVNPRKRTELTWKVVKNSDTADECGQYCSEENEIEVYWNNMTSVKEIVQTCIHEWVHYKQPIRTQYHRWKGPYSKNPFEIEATRKEKKYAPFCWEDIKKKVNR